MPRIPSCKAGTANPVGIYNNYGGTIGGPVKKDKIFYFGSFEATNQKLSGNNAIHRADC